jgi:hypothetical protein
VSRINRAVAGVSVRRDQARVNKLRVAVRYLIARDVLERGHQSRLAEHFDISRQRVHQVVNQEKARRALLIERVRMIRAAQAATARAE